MFEHFSHDSNSVARAALLAEITTHLDLPIQDRFELNKLDPGQVKRLYKKMYKHSLKEEEERYFINNYP